MADEERVRIYRSSMAYADWVAILANMRRSGFRPKGGWSPEIEALATMVTSDAWAPDPADPKSLPS
jgi:hypothetical protein